MADTTPAEGTLSAQGSGRFALTGALSFGSVTGLWRRTGELFAGGAGARSIDLAAASPVDSAGLALLVAWQARAGADGIALTFLNPPERLVALARISEVEPLLGFPPA
jgi:phospholipid transport system transporter-binding protein